MSVAGGWGVDALGGHQTPIHSDLDLAVDVTEMALDQLLQAFGRHGYAVEADWRPSRVALVAGGALPGIQELSWLRSSTPAA
jgi:lincosamide nucleotidyltransferase A/C/D/E